LNGLDDIGLTMQQQDKIKAFEAKHPGSTLVVLISLVFDYILSLES
jgi:hypothetical protein